MVVRNTREADRDNFYVERYQNCKYKNSPYYIGADLWKKLTMDLVQSVTLHQFKYGLRRLNRKYTPDA